MADLLGSSFCGSPPVIAGGLFLTALIGSFAHCVPMCGPFVMMQLPPDRGGPLLRRLAGAALIRYQAGRLITYIALGALAGKTGDLIAGDGSLRWPLAALFGLAALAFLARAAAPLIPLSSGVGLLLSRIVIPLAARQPEGFRLGLLLGLLPCGFLYAALAAAAATGSAVTGAAAMAAFGAGTVPGLVMVGLVGRTIIRRWQPMAAYLMTGLFLLNALTLSIAALHLLLS